MSSRGSPRYYFGGVCELSLLFLFPVCPDPVACVAGSMSCLNVSDGEASDGVDGSVVPSCGDDDWFVVCGVLAGGALDPAGLVTTVPWRGGRYNAPFCPHAAVSASGRTAAKHNATRLTGPPVVGHAAPTSHERPDRSPRYPPEQARRATWRIQQSQSSAEVTMPKR